MKQAIKHSLAGGAGSLRSPRAALWGVGLLLSLLIGILAYVAADGMVRADARRRFESIARSAQYSMAAKVKSYADVLRGLVALFDIAEGPVSREQFRQIGRASCRERVL